MPKKSPPSSIMDNLATDIHHRASIAFPDASPAPLSQIQNSQIPNSQVHSQLPTAGSNANFHPPTAYPHIAHAYCSPYTDPRHGSGGRRSFSNNSGYNPAIHFGMSPYPHPKPGPWMNKLCQEPEGDIGTCCIGCWAPCVLYGKTQYRLKQMSQGDDPLDLVGQKNRPALPMAERTGRGEEEEWEEVQGYKACNGPCWMHQMLCFFFRTEWCVVMLQHSRVRATYNIDGTAGGDCVQSYFCTRCTVMQDEREVIAREQRILRQQNGSGVLVTDQPGSQMQMRYSTSNLLEEIPDILREGFNGGANGYPSSSKLPSQQNSGRGSFSNGTSRGKAKGEHHGSHELGNLTPATMAYGTDTSDSEAEYGSRGRRSSTVSSRKLKVRESSPLGSALNPITVSRSASVDMVKNKKEHADILRRSFTNPITMRYTQAPVGAPSPRVLAYKLRSLDLGDDKERKAWGFEAIQERGSEESGPVTIVSRAAVKSLAMAPLHSMASFQGKDRDRLAKEKDKKSESEDELGLSDDGQTVFFGDDGRVIRRRISECLRPRASSTETPEIWALHHVGARTMNESKMPQDLLERLKTSPAPKPSPSAERSKVRIVGSLSAPIAIDTSTALSINPTYCQIQTMGPVVGLQKKPSISGKGRSMSTGSVHSDIVNLWRQAASSTSASSTSDKSPDTVGTVGEGSLALPQGSFAPSAMSPLRLATSEDEGTTGPISPISLGSPTFGESAARSGLVTVVCSPSSKLGAPGYAHTSARLPGVDRFPSCINTSDGSISAGPDTPMLDELVVGFVRTSSPVLTRTPKHKKSVSDWFKDIGRQNSKDSIHSRIFGEGHKDFPPVPSLPPVESSIWRPFSPLGIKERLVTRRGAANTMTAASRKMAAGERVRAVSSPFVGKKVPLMDATNESMGTERKASIEDSWRQSYLSGTLPSTISSTRSLNTATAETVRDDQALTMERRQSYSDALMALQDEPGTGSVRGLRAVSNAALMIAISTGSAIADEKAHTKLSQRAFPLVNSPAASLSSKTGQGALCVVPESVVSPRSVTPKRHLTLDSLGKNTGLAALDFGELETNHAKASAETESANAYKDKTLEVTIKEVAASSSSDSSTPTTLVDILKEVPLSSNLLTPSELPDTVVEYIPRESPILQVDRGTLKSEVEELPTPSEMLGQPITTDMAIHHDAECAETMSANEYSSASAVKAMQNMAKENGPTDNDPFFHPFFSGTAVIDFALIKPGSLEKQILSSEKLSSVFEAGETNPLDFGVAIEQREGVEANPLLEPFKDITTAEVELVEGKPYTIFEDSTATGYVLELDTRLEVLGGDDVTTIALPPDHPTSTERMDDAVAAILSTNLHLASSRNESKSMAPASAMHSLMAQPVLDSDELRGVCDRMNRGSLSYDTESRDEVLTLKKGKAGILHPVAVDEPGTEGRKVMREVSANVLQVEGASTGGRTVSGEKSDLELGSNLDMAAVNAKQDTSPTQRPEVKRESTVIVRHGVVHRDSGDGIFVRDKMEKLFVPKKNGKADRKTSGSPKRSQSPAETMLRGMLGKLAGKSSEHLPLPSLGGHSTSSSLASGDGKGCKGRGGEDKKETLRTPTPRIMVTSATSEDTLVAASPGKDKEAKDGKNGKIPKRRRGKRAGKAAK